MKRIVLALLFAATVAAAQTPTTVYTLADVAKHNTASSCWMVLSGNVYDFSGFLYQHPGGTGMQFYCGKDGSSGYAGVNHDQLANNMQPQYQIGVLGTAPPPPPVACTYSFSSWSACSASGSQSRTILSQTPVGCTPSSPAPALTQSCTPPPPPPVACSYTYNAWGACDASGKQTRTVATTTPTGCTPGTMILSQNCTPPPPPPVSCTSFTYTAWSTCAGGTQSRKVTASMPTGCTGGSPVLSQTCTVPPPPPVACTYTYSSWSACANGSQSRKVASALPTGCTGSPGALTQTCNVTPPPSGKPPLTLANHSKCRLCHIKGTPGHGGDD